MPTKRLPMRPLREILNLHLQSQLSNQMDMPDWESVRQELTGKNVTKHLLWEAYTQQYPNSSYSYSH